MPPPQQYRRQGGRSIVAWSAALSFLLLTIFAATQLTSSPRDADRSTLRYGRPAEHPSLLLEKARAGPTGDKYVIGVGKADITGPVVEINFAGYASLGQVGSGVRQRLYSRAFIVGDANNPNDRFVYLVLDTQSGDTAVRYGILEGLKALGNGYTMYGQNNVAVTGTHSHSGPGGWFDYLLPQITSLVYPSLPCLDLG